MKFGNGTSSQRLTLLPIASAVASALAFSVAHAQTATNPPAPATEQAAPADDQQAVVVAQASPNLPKVADAVTNKDGVATITVTGSRVIANGNNSPTPLTVMDTEVMAKIQPTTLTEQVNLLPALQGSQNVTSKAGGAQRNGAAAYFNLRNMGDLRTLVMIDGFRLVPTINQNQANVDASIVPQMLVKRVDVVTGGVSAVYGSDAVSGVVNFVTDTNFNGVKVQANKGLSTYHDDNTTDVGIAGGMKILDNRGHIEASLQHHDDPGIFDRSKRAFFAANTGGAGLGTAASPYSNIADQRMSNTTFGGLIANASANGGLKDLMFTPQGTLTPFVHGTSAGVANVESGGSGAIYNASIKSSIKYDQLFGRFDYDFGEGVKAWAQASYSDIHTANNYQSPNINNVKISYANPFLSNVQAPYAAILAASPNNTFTFSRFLTNDPRAEQTTKANIFMGGLSGSLGDDYKWKLGGQISQSQVQASNLYNVDNGRLYAALDAVKSNGQIVCRASLTNANYRDCVPLNVFGDGNASQSALNYIYRRTDNLNTTKMQELTAEVTGAPFHTWAGPVKMALSGELRRLQWDVQSNAGPNDLADCAGIQYNCTSTGSQATRQWFFNTQGGLNQVSQRVAESALEADIPLLRDAPFADSLNMSAAARYTHYNTSGGVWTAKLGATWDINDQMTLRATRSRDIRAPNLFELYAPIQINPGTTLTDIHTGQQGIVPNTQTSNPNLRPEKANTTTVGMVLTPSFAPGFSLAVDLFQIKVSDVIYLLAARSDASQRECENSGGTSPICALIQRPLPFSDHSAANFPTSTSSTFLNIASLETWGTDVEANYRTRIAGNALTLRGLVSYQPKLKYDQGPAGVVDLGNAYTGVNLFPAAPKLKATAMVSYDVTKEVNLTVLERWRSRMKVTALPTPVLVNPYVPSLAYTTINLSWKIPTKRGSYEAFFNVANAFNKFPTVYYPGPVGSPGTGINMPEGDDPIGRYYTVGLRASF